MKMKNNNINGRTFTKNQRLFNELFITHNERFFLPLMEIRRLFGLPKIKEIGIAVQVLGDKPKKKDWDRFLDLIIQCKTNRSKFFAIFDEVERNDFYNRIDRILINNKLGIEWRYSLVDVVISGLFIPPIYNLAIQSDIKNKTLNLKLNASTSLQDIKDAWGAVEKEKIRVFGKINRRNITKKSLENLITLAKAKQIQEHHPEIKGTDLIGRINPILDEELDDDTSDVDTDKKAAGNLRQIKSRFSRKV